MTQKEKEFAREYELLRRDVKQLKATAASGGATDLSYNSATRLLSSSTGNDVTLPLATPTVAGLTLSTGSQWHELATSWTATPTYANTIAAGDVYAYTYGATTYYRLVPSPYVSANDAFYSSFVNPTLSGLVASRGLSI